MKTENEPVDEVEADLEGLADDWGEGVLKGDGRIFGACTPLEELIPTCKEAVLSVQADDGKRYKPLFLDAWAFDPEYREKTITALTAGWSARKQQYPHHEATLMEKGGISLGHDWDVFGIQEGPAVFRLVNVLDKPVALGVTLWAMEEGEYRRRMGLEEESAER